MGLAALNIKKQFGSPAVEILKGISFEIFAGEFVAFKGRSGSGKSTLLYILSTLDRPTSGTVVIDGVEIEKLSSHALNRFRNERIGYVFQFHYLLPELSAVENVLMPARKLGVEAKKHKEALNLLDMFGLSHRLKNRPSQLSGGEQQRVAIARSLLMNPKVLFADEPTGNLDSVNSENVFSILKAMNRDLGTTIVLVTHDPNLARRTGRVIELMDGQVVNDQNGESE